MLPIRYHLPIMIACELLGFLVGAGVVIPCWIAGLLGESLWLAAIVLLAGVLVGALIPRILFRVLMPARCSHPDCHGQAFPVGTDPITYVCRRCGKQTATNVSDSDGREFRDKR